jgi:hypothetical protein
MKDSLCVICKGEIVANKNGWAGGNNAMPVASGKCCDDCNTIVVLAARLKQIGYSNEQTRATQIFTKYLEID